MEKENIKETKDKPRKAASPRLESLNRNVMYVIVFSLLGLLMEFIYGYLIAKEKGLVLGPLCVIYGLCALILLKALSPYKDNKIKVFLYGTAIATLMEYSISFIVESAYGVKVWDFSGSNLNFNERINTIHIPVFGILSVIIILLKPALDIVISKIKGKLALILDICIITLLTVEILYTVWGLAVYKTRVKDLLSGKNYTENNTWIQKFQNEAFSNENMKKLFPNLIIINNEGNKQYIKEIIQ